MAERDTLLETVRNLVQRGTEGTHWDFKRQHHENKADLIHDVLCLANADHDGDRFLIFGIHDGTLAVHSVRQHPKPKEAGLTSPASFETTRASSSNPGFRLST